jgi:hypothetical protein
MRSTTHVGQRGVLRVAAAALVLVTTACQDEPRTSALTAPESGPLFAAASALPQINNSRFTIPVRMNANLTADACTNNPGPQITLSGLAVLGGWGVEMDFTNNLKGTHTYTAENTVSATALAAGEEIVIPKQPVLGGTGGNPFIWVQFMNGDGSAATEEIFVGRCVQGSSWKVNGPPTTVASAWATFAVESCENSPGPFISMGSGMALGGMVARVIFRNNDNPVGGPHETDVVRRDVVLIEPRMSFTFPKQPVLGGVGGNPWIFAGFADSDGRAMGEKTLVGRCEQLSKAL